MSKENLFSWGDVFVLGMESATVNSCKGFLLMAFREYNNVIGSDEVNQSHWSSLFKMVELVAVKLGYHGTLELCLEEMEPKLIEALQQIVSKEDMNKFIMECSDCYEGKEHKNK
jgi:hypothetical protein